MGTNTTQRRPSLLGRVWAYFDPTRDGYVRRMVRFAAVLLAIGACGACAALTPMVRTPFGRYLTAVTLLELERYDWSEEVARDLVRDFPNFEFGYYRVLAAALRRSGQYEEQLEVFDAAVAALPGDALAHSQRCWYGTLFGDPSHVMDSCDQAVAKATAGEGLPFTRRAFARGRLGDLDGAEADLAEGLKRWSEHHTGPAYLQRSRRAWLDDLQAGRNPFDEATLQRERERF